MTPGGPSEDDSIQATCIALGRDAWIAPSATLTGRVTIGDGASVWHGCVLRGDLAPIAVGAESNVQDLTVVHVDRGYPVSIGRRVTIGHRAVVHGCTIGDDAVIGMGAVLLTGSRIGTGALVTAGAVLREGFEVPAGAIAAGVPAVIRGEVGPGLRRRFDQGVTSYLRLAARARSGA